MVVAGALLMTPTTMHAWDTNTVFDRRPRKTTVRFATQPFLQDSHHEHQGPPRLMGIWHIRSSTIGVGVRF